MRVRSVDPATLETVADVAAASPDDVRAAVARARAAQAAWAACPLAERLATVHRFGDALLARMDDAARLVTREMGKPLPEAYASDVLPALDACDWLADHARGVLAPEPFRLRNPLLRDRRSQILRVPRGVVGVIAPWNYPLALAAVPALYALAAGNTVVLKPAEQTPGTGSLVADLAREAGFPAGALEVVQGPGEPTGAALVDAEVDFLVFTGSTDVGLAVAKKLDSRGVRCALELGGSDPALVLADADLATAVNGVAWGRFTNTGQTCAAVKRALVHADVHDAFVERLVAAVERLRVGPGLEDGTDVGPLLDEDVVRAAEAFVDDALKRGATLRCGGRRLEIVGHFFAPTVLTDVPADARVLKEEVFGPILPVVRCADEEEMVRVANATRFGLSASVWTRDVARGRALAARLDAGTVVVNDAAYTFAANETPWGGVKASGRGWTHGEEGLRELTTLRHVNWGAGKRPLAELWWYPYRPGAAGTWTRALRFLYGGLGAKARASGPVAAALLRKKNL